MRNTQYNNNKFCDMSVIEMLSIASSTFFTSLLVLAAYLMSIQNYNYGFASLVASGTYFAFSNAANLKLLTALAWAGVSIFALKGMLGV